MGGEVTFSGKKRYEGVRYNVISVTRGWVGVKFPGKKRYVTLEWPLTLHTYKTHVSQLKCSEKRRRTHRGGGGGIQVLHNVFSWKLDPHPPTRNANNVETTPSSRFFRKI